MKRCTRCGILKEDHEFNTYKKYGKVYLKSMCKPCQYEYYKPYLKEYEKKPERREAQRKRATSERGRELGRIRSQRYRSKPDGRKKDNVRGRLYQAIKSGKIVVPDACSECGKVGKVEAHHEDYDKPFDVIWLCKQCHENRHHLNGGHESM